MCPHVSQLRDFVFEGKKKWRRLKPLYEERILFSFAPHLMATVVITSAHLYGHSDIIRNIVIGEVEA